MCLRARSGLVGEVGVELQTPTCAALCKWICVSVLVSSSEREEGNTQSGRVLHQVTGCHVLHSWQSWFSKVAVRGVCFCPGSWLFE